MCSLLNLTRQASTRATGLTGEDIGRPKERGKAILKEMAVRLIERRSAEEAIKDYDSQIANQ